MIKTILKREMIQYLKNPIYYIGAILVFLSVYSVVSPYLGIHYFKEESEIKTLEMDTGLLDADIMDGYIPTTDQERYDMGLDRLKADLTNEYIKMPEEEVNSLIRMLKESKWSITKTAEYLEKNYSFGSAKWYFLVNDIKKATVEEANQYIKNAFAKETYSSYFSRKYVDYFTLCMVFYAIVIFAFLFMSDSKKDIYELLHTKQMKAWQYIVGKIAGGMTAILLVVIIITSIFDVLVMLHGQKVGFPVAVGDLWYSIILFVLPNLFMVISVYTLVSILLKNPLPAVPALVLYVIYSNLGCEVSEDCITGYRVRQLAILVRFPDVFFETVTPNQAVFNQLYVMLVAVLLIILSSSIWKRRRYY